MKRALSISISLIFVLASLSFARPIDLDTAVNAGRAHLRAQEQFWEREPSLSARAFLMGQRYSVSGVREIKDGDKILAYILNLNPEGFIAVSPDTDIRPVIAYSFEGEFPIEDTFDNVLLHLLKWDMENRLSAIPITSSKVKRENNVLWEEYLSQSETIVTSQQWGPWLETTWGQGYPYNKYCPIDPVTGNRSVTGCVATAMAQIINYWKYPNSVSFGDADRYTSDRRGIKIDDDHQTYDFPSFSELNQMLSDIKYNGNTDEIAALCFACGISVEMDYSSEGSGAFIYDALYAYKGKFGYDSARLVFGFIGDFYDLLEGNMKSALPAQLAIFEKQGTQYKKGHSIVADGLKDTGEYHLNFGWNGFTDGWYFLPNGMPYGYNVVDSGVLDIYPGDQALSMVLSAPNGGEEIKGGSLYHITWSAKGAGIDHIHLQYSADSGGSYYDIIPNTENDGVYEWTTPALDSSTMRVRAIAEDINNNVLADDESDADFTIDSTAPITTASLSGTQGENGWYVSDVLITLSAMDNLSGVKEVRYKIDEGAWETYTSPIIVTGSTIAYYAEDFAGNISAEQSIDVKIDKTPPSTPIVTDDGELTCNNSYLHAVWTPSSDPESGISGYEYAIGTTAGGNDVVDWTSVGTDTEVVKTDLSLELGQAYYFAVRAKNSAGLSSVGVSDGIVCQLPRISVTPTALTFNILTNFSMSGTQKLNVTNSSCGTLHWTVSSDVDWLSCTPTSGESIGETDEITVLVDATGLADGTYTGTITVSAVSAENSPQTVPVTLNVLTLPDDSLVVQTFGPVDLLVEDPQGQTTNKDTSTIPSAVYIEMDLDGDTRPEDIIFIPHAMPGRYAITAIPEPSADPTDVYTLNVVYSNSITVLAEDIQIGDIPTEPYNFFFPLYRIPAGWSLISIPVQSPDSAISAVLQSIEGHYQSLWTYEGQWKRHIVGADGINNLWTIDPGKGYWIKMEDSAVLTIVGDPIADPSILLNAGWNMVGYNSQTAKPTDSALSSIAGEVVSVWAYDNGWKRYIMGAGDNNLETMKPGMGYWINVSSACVWDIDAENLAPPVVKSFMGTATQPASHLSSGVPEIPYVLYGNIEIDGVRAKASLRPAPEIILKVSGRVCGSYQLGSISQYGDLYVLDVPAMPGPERIELSVRIGDVPALPVAIAPPGMPGQTIRFDLSVRTIPKVSKLHQNYPNPFNPDTWIPYQLESDADVTISIHTSTGQLVRILDLGHKPAGFYTEKENSAYWDGKNSEGEHVASGVYFYTIRAGDFSATRKMVIMR